MVEMNPTSQEAFGARQLWAVDLSKKHHLKQLLLRVVAKGWQPPVGAILPDDIVLDSLKPHVNRSCEPSGAIAADRVIGSCAFMLSGHGDLRIEWEEKDHDEVVKLIEAKMKAGVRFFIREPASFTLVPIRRRNYTIGREVYVHDADIKKLIEGGFARFPTTRLAGIGQLETHTHRIAKSAEEAARAHTIAGPRMQGAEGDGLIGAAAIAAFLHHELKIGLFTARTVYNWAQRGKLPVRNLPHSTTLFASKSVLRQWFHDIGRGIDPTLRHSGAASDTDIPGA